MTVSSSLPYRPCAGMMVINSDNQIFVGKRIDMPSEFWQMPQGGIDEGENAEEAAKRELLEEIGTDKVEQIHRLDDWLTYDLPDHLIGKVWKGKYRGQKQKWFLFRFTGRDVDINIATDHQEFSEWKWTDLDTLVREIVPFKQDLYRIIANSFQPFI